MASILPSLGYAEVAIQQGFAPSSFPFGRGAFCRGHERRDLRETQRSTLCTLCTFVAACRWRAQARKAGSASGSSPLNLGKSRPKEKIDSGSWVLPSVDKDVDEYFAGRAPTYAWVQTSETLYVFAPLEAAHGEELDAPNVTLDLQQEGTIIRLIVGGQTILNGRLAHQIKPGEQIWMVEEASDGKDFVVCELDKLTPGVNWASVMEPEVEAVADYARAVVEMPEILTEEEERLVDETLHHLQRTHRTLRPVEGRAASIGDVVTVDMQGYELQPDGSRGNPLEIGSATGLDIELGSGAFSRQVEANLEGIQVGESRDVQVTLGQRAGGLGGSSIICAVTCQALQEQQLPELSDEFAKVVKRQDLFKQAGTAEGIPEEEEGVAESFTMADLRAEIVQEVRQAAQTQVRCHWAELGSQEAVLEEELFVRVRFVAEREGLMSYIDMDAVDRQAWDKLGEPDDGESLKQVGKDPAREYQDAHTVVFREHLMNEVLHWLRQQMEIVVEEGQ
ncbi:unnamed protein product [Durusdinium trenchii]|uniref:CS domain-containing protein n=1 Tax=Durusdinium trenchii TaxID=1381693 RepID=A0ABP0KDE3_9DINO